MLLFIGIAFVALLVLGLPIGMILLALSVLYVLFEPAIMDLAFAQRVITGTQSFPLLAVPLFILTGELLLNSGIAAGMFMAIDRWVRVVPGGLLHTIIGSSGCSRQRPGRRWQRRPRSAQWQSRR